MFVKKSLGKNALQGGGNFVLDMLKCPNLWNILGCNRQMTFMFWEHSLIVQPGSWGGEIWGTSGWGETLGRVNVYRLIGNYREAL